MNEKKKGIIVLAVLLLFVVLVVALIIIDNVNSKKELDKFMKIVVKFRQPKLIMSQK